jgi:hypothetical protein
MAQGNRVLSLDGDGDYVIRNPISNFPTREITAEIWMKSSDNSKIGTPISYSTSSVRDDFEIYNYNDFNPHVNNKWPGTTGVSANDGNWHHIAVTWISSDGQVKIYKDGAVAYSGTLAIGEAIMGGGSLVIGQEQDSVGGDFDPAQAFKGLIDEVRIWNVALTQEEIQATMNTRLIGNEPDLVGYWNFDDGTANDLSPNGNHGALKGDAEIIEAPNLPIEPILVAPRPIIPQTVGQSFTLAIDTATVASLHNFSFDLTFDPTVLRALRIDPSSFLSRDDVDPITCETAQIDNATGRITGISCQRDDADGVSGRGVLAQITFEPIQIGESVLQIENASFSAPDGTPIEFGTREGKVSVYAPHGRITGHVVDFEGNSVRGVEVVALKGDVPVGISGKTDRNGDYVIENITEAGEVTVRAKVAGSLPGVATVLVEIGETTAGVNLALLKPDLLHGVVDAEGFIPNWMLLGPIAWEDDANRLISDQLDPKANPGDLFPPPEKDPNPLDPQEGEYGTGLGDRQRWTLHMDSNRDIDLAGLYGQSKGVVYAFTQIRSPADGEVALRIGSGDGVIVWLNNNLVHRNGAERSRNADQDTVENLTLKKGWNRLLVKVENRGGGWGFLARFVDADGNPITDLDVSPQPIDDIVTEFGTFDLTLDKGLNFISLPVDPLQSFTAQRLIDKIGVNSGGQPVATMVVRYDTALQTFIPYLPELSDNFPILGGGGYIVNVTEATIVTFTGKVWDNVNTAASSAPLLVSPQFWGEKQRGAVWAFAVGGRFFGNDSDHRAITVRNRRTGEILRAAQHDGNRYAVAFANLNRRRVVEAGDVLEIGIDGTGEHMVHPYTVTAEDLRRAFARIDLSQSAFQPEKTRLLQNYPNPFNPETWMPYQLAADALVEIQIYDMQGRLARRLDLGHQSAGYYDSRHRAAHWDGKNETGEFVSSGLYFYQLQAGDYTATRRMVILK